MLKLEVALAGVTLLGFDTAPLIYFVEANSQYDALVTEVVRRIVAGNLNGITSVITLLEVLVVPLRSNNIVLQQEYRDLLLNSNHFHCQDITIIIAEVAVDLRARYNLRTPDALQIAAALQSGCQAFITNDTGLKRVIELRVLTLNELEL